MRTKRGIILDNIVIGRGVRASTLTPWDIREVLECLIEQVGITEAKAMLKDAKETLDSLR